MNEEAKYVPTKYDSVFWIDVERIVPNPYQPRREFSEDGLRSLAESIRQYGVLQPLVVSRVEVEKADGGLETQYELVAGERRLRASKLAGLSQVPVVIRQGDTNLNKLELAIIENLQREDLNAIDRAKALKQLIDEFGISHAQTAAKIGRSREYVSNSLRLLSLPEHMQSAIINKEITEGHARPLMALNDRAEEQETLFKEIILKKLPVRVAERIARSIAQERVRSHHKKTPEMAAVEKTLAETLGTRVIIEASAEGGRLLIDFFSPDDLQHLVDVLATKESMPSTAPEVLADEHASEGETPVAQESAERASEMPVFPNTTQLEAVAFDPVPAPAPEEPDEDELYSVSNFAV